MVNEGNVSQLETEVLRAVRNAARRSHTAQRGFVEYDDLVQSGYEWVLMNMAKVKEWVEDGSTALLQHAVYQYLHNVTMKERYAKDGTRPEDYYSYQYAVLEELLPEVLAGEPNYGGSSSDLNALVRSGRSPAEGGERMAMIADVKAGMLALNDYDRELIVLKYTGQGRTDNELAQWFEKPEATINRHVRAALRKIARRLGSEPVRKRRVMSNAQAQHVTREQG